MPILAPATRALRFETFELDLRTSELRKSGIKLRLQGQPLQLLAILLQSAGELVTREELRKQLWPADTFVDFDHSLHNAIGRIREVLGDSADVPRYIETLPRRGYRFIAAVQEVRMPRALPDSAAKAFGSAAAVAATRQRAISLLVLIVFCAGGLAVLVAWPHSSVNSAQRPIRSIAVLPMQNFSGDPAQEYFSDGMTEALITELSRIHSIKVVSRTSVMAYKGTNKRLPQIAHELGVDGVLEGSVSRAGDQVRIIVQLLDGPNDRHLWSDTYQREMRDILTLQSGIADAIAQQIQIKLTPQQHAHFSAARAVAPAAYESYLKGRSNLWSSSTPQELKEAQRNFQQAIRKDPGFALGYVGLADSYVSMASFRQLSPQDAYGPANESLRKALQLDDSISEAYDTLAVLSWRYDWDWAATESQLDRSLALDPNNACAHADRANFLSWSGRRAEALAEINASYEIDPSFSYAVSESAGRFLLGDREGLLEASQKAVVSNPNDWLAHYFLGVGRNATGKPQESIPEFQKAVELTDGDQDAAAALAHSYAVTGNKAEAEKILRNLQQKSKTQYVSPYMIAAIYAGLGEKEEAFEFLERAYREKCWDLVWQLKNDPRIDNLRSDPRFQDLLRRFAFPQ